ncbi:MAG: imidazole glycerol phosphate synthase subunit HisH [bacterium]|nr:imidazole glycerol phosphate synthase subunit HisH [bacterium]
MSSKKLVIIDYKMGNLGSVYNAFRFLKHNVEISDSPQKLMDCDGMVLPGVGAFGDAMKNLNRSSLADTIRSEIKKGKPYLGICLGYQMLFESSEEDRDIKGLGVLKGGVVRFRTDNLKVPHIGWNQIKIQKESMILKEIGDNSYLYFVHSYYPDPEDEDLALTRTEYGESFVSAVAKDNIFAFQFHPEKSQESGLKILKNFGDMCVHHTGH